MCKSTSASFHQWGRCCRVHECCYDFWLLLKKHLHKTKFLSRAQDKNTHVFSNAEELRDFLLYSSILNTSLLQPIRLYAGMKPNHKASLSLCMLNFRGRLQAPRYQRSSQQKAVIWLCISTLKERKASFIPASNSFNESFKTRVKQTLDYPLSSCLP